MYPPLMVSKASKSIYILKFDTNVSYFRQVDIAYYENMRLETWILRWCYHGSFWDISQQFLVVSCLAFG